MEQDKEISSCIISTYNTIISVWKNSDCLQLLTFSTSTTPYNNYDVIFTHVA